MDKKIEELQVLENHLQNFLAQKQSLQVEMNEVDNALQEIKSSEEIYKITAGFLIKAEKEKVKKELEEKKRMIGMKIESIEKQEKLVMKDVLKLKGEINKSV